MAGRFRVSDIRSLCGVFLLTLGSAACSGSTGESGGYEATPIPELSTVVVSESSPTTTLAETSSSSSSSSVVQLGYFEGLVVRADHVVKFEVGATSTLVEGAVIRGERDVFRVGAAKGQTLELTVSSVEDNAVFDVVAPDGSVIATEQTSSVLVLPSTGDYVVVVGGTRGNATYELAISVPA